eukprot:CAMPEP_0119074480 /NCGR_PEP_ID=MMETSP1178-20130426/72141_1 /TAXON_ID=33656 /ORGANISM="unid sp, Strain CCMP2000" /LENGTH=206 /DNA_ID=CAMNT_0007056641 /DNA_START=35 /DNA_END=655 /DNA_ORIENTATION=-
MSSKSDWKVEVDSELARLRAKESALKAAGKTDEVKAIAHRKGELKLMKKKGISPVIARPGNLQSWSSGMPAAMPSVPKPKWVSDFPNFTPPSEDDAAEFAGTMSFGTLTGFCSGYALKSLGRAGAFTVGCLFMGLTGLQRTGYIEVNWNKVEADVMGQLDLDGDGKVDRKDAQVGVQKIVRYMADENSAVTAGTFLLGFLLGLRKG